MKHIVLFLMLTAGGLFAQTQPHNKEAVYSFGGALAHFLDGDGWKTTFTLVNLDPTQASFTLSFLGDNGKPDAIMVRCCIYPGCVRAWSVNYRFSGLSSSQCHTLTLPEACSTKTTY